MKLTANQGLALRLARELGYIAAGRGNILKGADHTINPTTIKALVTRGLVQPAAADGMFYELTDTGRALVPSGR